MFENFRTYLESQPQPEPEDIDKVKYLEQLIGASIEDPFLFVKALRHRSSLVDRNYNTSDSYERLEFLGDAVLDLIVSELIFDHYPKADEGFLTKLRAQLVNGDALASYAREMDLSSLVIVGKRAQGQGIELSKGTLSDVFESIIGAIYVTKGYAIAASFVDAIIKKYVNLNELTNTSENYKSLLLEYAQAKNMVIPRYEVIKESGPDHDKTFQIGVIVDEKEQGQGTGKNKKEAEQKAACHALKELKKD